jgi:hypothetical protein
MVALLPLLLLAAPAQPPTDSGASCEAWVIADAQRLAVSPQLIVAPLGPDRPGLADLPMSLWESLHEVLPSPSLFGTPADRERRRAALEGSAPISTAPELIETAQRLDTSLSELLSAARGSRNRLPRSLDIWTTLNSGPDATPTFVDIQNILRLTITRGWVALASNQTRVAADSCVGSWGLIRAVASTSLLGRMIATISRRSTRALCLEAARLATKVQRETLASDLNQVGHGWPDFGHTLEEELVFSEVAFMSDKWSEDQRSKLPTEAQQLAAKGRIRNEEASWLTRARRAIFGGWASRDYCLSFARPIAAMEGTPKEAEAALRSLAQPLFSWKLAAWDEGSPSDWVSYFRRTRELDAELQLVIAGLAAWNARDADGDWPASFEKVGRFVDPRTGQQLDLVRSGTEVTVVARADPAFGAEELRAVLDKGK